MKKWFVIPALVSVTMVEKQQSQLFMSYPELIVLSRNILPWILDVIDKHFQWQSHIIELFSSFDSIAVLCNTQAIILYSLT